MSAGSRRARRTLNRKPKVKRHDRNKAVIRKTRPDSSERRCPKCGCGIGPKWALPYDHVELHVTAPSSDLINVRRRADRAAGSTMETIVTCPASRHVEDMAATLSGRDPEYPMFEEDPQHCAASLYAVLEALWKARAEIKRLGAPAKDMACD